jgi:hypothetical protein
MSENRPQINPDPVGLWRQWYEANSRAWSSVLGGDAEALMDPFGLYRQWSGGLQEEARNPPEGAPSAEEFWGQWVEATTDVGRRYAEYVSLLVGFTPLWAEMAQEVPRQMLGEGKVPTDPLDFYTRLYNATNGPLSKMIRGILENETFLADARRFSENRASLEAVLGDASERYFGDNLRLSTRSDNTRVARLVVGLEDKLDRLEEAFEEFEYGYAKPATDETVSALEERIGGLEQKLDDNRSDLARVEDKLDRLFAALDTAANGDARTAGDAGEKGEG